MPGYVMEGEPYRPEIIFWLELPDDLIVGSALIDPNGPPVTVSQVLLDATKRPMAGVPRRPQRVRVANDTLAAEVRSALPGVEVVVAPTPELRAIVDLMAQRMPSNEGKASYLEGGRVSASSVERLFRAAETLWRMAPWKVAHDSQIVRVDAPQLGVNGACLSIIGNLGESIGLLLFPSLAGFDAFLAAGERKRVPLDLGTTVLSLEFERGAELPTSLRREVAAHGWPVASTEAYPRVEHRDRDGMPRPTAERDVRAVARVAEAFVPFFLKHRNLFSSDKTPDPVCESYYDEEDVEVRFTVPYEARDEFKLSVPQSTPRRAEPKVPRNAPCPCGSGNKYKKCCLPKDEAARASGPSHVHHEDERLVFEMMRFAAQQFGTAWRRSERDFTDADAARQIYRPWSVYCFLVEGRPVVDWFLEARHAHLRTDERAWLEAQKRSWMGVWETLAVETGRSVTVRDLLSGEQRTVREVSGSKTLKLRDTLLGRVVDHDGASVFVGIHPRPLTPEFADDVMRSARRKLRAKTMVPLDRLREESFGRHLVKRWERAVAEMDARALVPPRLHNTDGDPLLMTTDHFTFERENGAEVQKMLAAMEGVHSPEDGDPEQSFTFLRVGNSMHKDWENTVFGRAVLGDEDLRLETNSVRRGDDLRRDVEEHLGSLVRFRAREHSDPLSQGNRLPPGTSPPDNEIPPDVQVRLLREYKEQHYAAWLDQPIPALAGKTPRQAARTKAGRAKVDLLLKDIENHEARLPDGARYDFSRLRSELRLAP